MATLGAILRQGALTGWGPAGLRVVSAALDDRGDLRLCLEHGGRETRSIVYGAASSPAMGLPAPPDARARAEAVLAGWAARPWAAWSEVAGALLDAWIDAPPAGSLAAWCAAGLVVPEVEVHAAGLVVRLATQPATLRRDWRGFGELSAPARVRRRAVVHDTEGGVAGGEPPAQGEEVDEHVHAGALRMGRLGAASDRLPVDAVIAARLWDAWCDRVARRLGALVAAAGADGMVVPWLVQPRAPFGEIVERWMAEGPPPAAPGHVAPDDPRVAALAARLRADPDGADAGDGARAHVVRVGEWRVTVDVPGGRLVVARGEGAPAVLVRTDPWEAGRRAGLDGDVATTLALARALGHALARAGLDAEVSWVPWDPDVARADEIPEGARLSTWLAFGAAAEEVEPPLDWRVEGLGLDAAPWPTWEGPGLDAVPAGEVARQVTLRDAFAREVLGSVAPAGDAVVLPGGVDPGHRLA